MRTCVALASLLALAAPALAEEVDEKTERARTHLKAGVSYYDEGRYEDAAREMEAAYSLKPLPDLQYNLAQCYERLNRLDTAADAYRKYLDGKPGAEDAKQIEARIANLKGRAAGGAAAPLPAEKVVFKTIVVYKEAPPAPGRAARWAAWGVGVLALASLGAGITFTVLTMQASDYVTKNAKPSMPSMFDGPASEAQARGQTDQVIAAVAYGVAGVALLGAIGLYALGNKIDREAPKLTLAPTLSPSGGGIAFAGVF